jgi:hypothetical protein
MKPKIYQITFRVECDYKLDNAWCSSPMVTLDDYKSDCDLLISLLRMVSSNLHHPQLGGISSEQLAAIDEALE